MPFEPIKAMQATEKQRGQTLGAEQLAALPDAQIDYSDIPELGTDFWKTARLVEPKRAADVFHETMTPAQRAAAAIRAEELLSQVPPKTSGSKQGK